MATQFLAGLGRLNQFLSSEVQRVREETKAEQINRSIAASADTFRALPADASESDVVNAMYDAIDQASLTGTAAQTLPVISAMYSQELQSMQRAELKAKDEALAATVSEATGLPLTGLGGQGALGIAQMLKPSVQQVKTADEEGTYVAFYKFDPYTQEATETTRVQTSPVGVTEAYEQQLKLRQASRTPQARQFETSYSAAGTDPVTGRPIFYRPGDRLPVVEISPGNFVRYTGNIVKTSTEGALASKDIARSEIAREEAKKQAVGLVNMLQSGEFARLQTPDDIETLTGDPLFIADQLITEYRLAPDGEGLLAKAMKRSGPEEQNRLQTAIRAMEVRLGRAASTEAKVFREQMGANNVTSQGRDPFAPGGQKEEAPSSAPLLPDSGVAPPPPAPVIEFKFDANMLEYLQSLPPEQRDSAMAAINLLTNKGN